MNDWNPMTQNPETPGKYMVRTPTDCWFIATYGNDGWNAPDAKGAELIGWAPLQ